MLRVFVAAVLVVVAMAVIKDGRTLHETGILSACTSVTAPPGEDDHWEACRPGKLEGRPNLTRHSCVSAGLSGATEYWRCPSRVAKAPRA
jgi:hypothetical protein